MFFMHIVWLWGQKWMVDWKDMQGVLWKLLCSRWNEFTDTTIYSTNVPDDIFLTVIFLEAVALAR